MKKSLLLCSLLCLAILEMYGQKQPRAMVHDEIANRFMPERHMNVDSLFMRRHNRGDVMSGKMDADRAELLGRHNMDAEQRLNAVKKADRENTKGDGTFVDQSDSLALVALYNSTDGPGWNNSTNWLTGPVSTWYGVDVLSGKVFSIDLFDNSLYGSIPPEIGNLASLQYLNLNSNQLSGSIPPEMGSLDSLKTINLSNNQLSGSIPTEIGNLASLQYLYLWFNQLSGAIPPEIGNLASLQCLDLSSNKLSGAIPLEIGSLASLQYLYLYSNQLSGSIPTEIGNLTNLVDLYLCNNQLSGTIPHEIGSLTSLQHLNFGNNQLSGSIPTEIGNLTNLVDLYLYNNQLSGAIPPEIGSLTSLQYLNLYFNQLSGAIPPEIFSLTILQMLALSNNQLSGALPRKIGNLNILYYLDLSCNQLSGTIPPRIGNLTNLWYLYLNSNQLSGAIPSEIGNLTSLQYLYLDSNQLSGAIPPEIGSLASLKDLYLSSNQLSGAIPHEMGNLTSLQYLYLNSNQLSGAIPPEIGNLTNLKTIKLSNNQLSGALPPEMGNLASLQRFYLNSNQLSDLPDLSESLSLVELNTSSNHLTFEDIEPNLSIPYFNYSPQARVGSLQHYTPNDGDNLDISVSVGGANNTYQWYRDGASIPGATGATYSISSYSSVADAGVYLCRIQNSMATELTLESYCIYVGVDVPTYTVDVSASPVSSGTVSGGGTYEDGQTATVSATPSTGYRFASWTSNGTEVSTSSTFTFMVTGDSSLVANFELKTYAVSATSSPAGSGTVTGAGTYSHGASVTLVATPSTGYRFASWTSNGTEVSTSSTFTFVVTGDSSLVANFELKTYAVSATSSPAGSGTVTGAGTYSHGASVTLEATPNTGYRFASWTSNSTVVSTNSTYSFVVTSDTSLVANFEDISGIIEDGLKESISIYPNPTNRHITVSGEGAGVKSVAVYDFMGRLRGRYNVNTDEAIIDFTGYPSGVYLVVVKTNMGIFTKKIVRE
ncbi:MAG: leucine-rich repeat domain-containing protein [Tenuifilaceae bacterium]